MTEWTMKRKAHIRQRIAGTITAIITAAFWLWLTTYGPEYLWYGCVALPIISGGVWLATTPRNMLWEIYLEGKEREEND